MTNMFGIDFGVGGPGAQWDQNTNYGRLAGNAKAEQSLLQLGYGANQADQQANTAAANQMANAIAQQKLGLITNALWGGRNPSTGQMMAPIFNSNLSGQLSNLFSQHSGGNGSIQWNPIAQYLSEGLAQRQAQFAPGSGGRVDPGYRSGETQQVIGQMQDMLSDRYANARREQASQGMDQQFNSSQLALRNMQSQRGLPPMTAQARMADLLRSRMQSQADLERGLALGQQQQRQSMLQSLGGMIGDDASRRAAAQQFNAQMGYNEATQRLGNPELAAQMNLQTQQGNMQNQMSQAQLLTNASAADNNQKLALLQLLG